MTPGSTSMVPSKSGEGADMTHRVRTIAVAVLLALFSVSAPAAAQASSIYPPVDACGTTPAAVSLGEPFTLDCGEGTFSANETVTVTITGENAASSKVGAVRFAISTLSKTFTSTDAGALDGVTVTLPSDGSGIYNIAAVSATSAGGTGSVSVLGTDGLPTTGGDSAQLMGLWIGGGALVLAGIVVVIAVVLRRRSDD